MGLYLEIGEIIEDKKKENPTVLVKVIRNVDNKMVGRRMFKVGNAKQLKSEIKSFFSRLVSDESGKDSIEKMTQKAITEVMAEVPQ